MPIDEHDGELLAVVGFHPDGRIAQANAQAKEVFGYSWDELAGQPVALLVPDPTLLSAAQRTFADAAVSGRSAVELACRRKDGTVFPADVSLSTLESESGPLVAAALRYVHEVMGTHRLDAAFRGLLEATTIATIGVDADGHIKFANSEAERLFGYDPDELRGQRVEALVPDQLRSAHMRHRSAFLAEPRTRRMGEGQLLEGQRKDGSRFPAEVSLAIIDTDTEPLVVAAVLDISSRLRAQADEELLTKELHTAQRLESLAHLAGGVAHNFNNLLAIISSNAELVEEELTAVADLPAWTDALQSVARIQRAAQRAAVQAQQLLAFGRRDVAKPVSFDLNLVLRDVERLLRNTLDTSVELDVDTTMKPLPVYADPSQLEQVVINLALNARDAMPGGGQLHICSEFAVLDEEAAADRRLPAGDYIRLEVHDTGVGMTADVAERVFEPFFTTKEVGVAGGMGLAIVHGVITDSGGHVSVQSEPGHGTTITVLLPASVEPETAAPSAGVPASAGNGVRRTVLVVDDEEDLRDVCHRILSRGGYEVLVASDGQEALDVVRANPDRIDVLLTDITMPGMGGAEVAEKIKALRPGIRVVFMSGYARPFLTKQGRLEAGVTLIEKPFTVAALLSTIAQSPSVTP